MSIKLQTFKGTFLLTAFFRVPANYGTSLTKINTLKLSTINKGFSREKCALIFFVPRIK